MDSNLQNVAPVTAHHTDPQVSKKMLPAKFGGGLPNSGTQRVLVAGGSGQVSSLHTMGAPIQPAQEYVDHNVASLKKDAN